MSRNKSSHKESKVNLGRAPAASSRSFGRSLFLPCFLGTKIFFSLLPHLKHILLYSLTLTHCSGPTGQLITFNSTIGCFRLRYTCMHVIIVLLFLINRLYTILCFIYRCVSFPAASGVDVCCVLLLVCPIIVTERRKEVTNHFLHHCNSRTFPLFLFVLFPHRHVKFCT